MGHGAELTAIIPVTNMNGRLRHFRSNVQECQKLGVKLVVVHDKRDEATGLELQSLLKLYGPEGSTYIEGNFGSAARARNAGLTACRSKWVCFWDCDDLVYVDKFLEMINLAESSLSEVAIGRISVQPVHSMGKQEISDKVVNNKCLDLQIANFPAFTRMGFNRDLLQENPFPEIHLGEDLIFLLNNELPLKKISISDQVVYCYRVGDPNQATKKYRDQNNIVDLLSRIEMILRTCSPKARRMNLAFADKLLLSLVRRGAQEKLSNEAFRIICKVTIHNLISPRLAIKIIFYFCSNRPRVIRALNGK